MATTPSSESTGPVFESQPWQSASSQSSRSSSLSIRVKLGAYAIGALGCRAHLRLSAPLSMWSVRASVNIRDILLLSSGSLRHPFTDQVEREVSSWVNYTLTVRPGFQPGPRIHSQECQPLLHFRAGR